MFRVLDISSNADNNEFNTCISADTFPTSENQSRGQLSSVSDEISKLIPSVLNELAKVGKENVLQKFFSQVSCTRFPLNNIAFQLWCDVVDWFDNSVTRQMRYAPQTMQFCWVGKKLFGGRFIRFMSGMKNETQQLTGSYVYDPQLSKINFACPCENILANFNPFDDKLPLVFPPGFLEQIIEYKAENDGSKKS